ncbi:hypothetical protein UP09_31000 [Bradyrhizobium sp. LTSP885]|nr:hypothetical protein UP09_31000 [Bradyrhizobium sp. LTSP885]
MSVDIIRWMAEAGLHELYYLPDETFGARRINVGFLRSLGLQVGWDPDSGHHHHGTVWGVKQTHRRKIARVAILSKKAEGET